MAAIFWLKPWGERLSFLRRIAKLVECEPGAAGDSLWEVLPVKEATPKEEELRRGQQRTPDDFFFKCNIEKSR